MFPIERQEAIYRYIKEKQKVSIEELSNFFKVSKVTIRLDIGELEKKKLVLKTHGGVVDANYNFATEVPYDFKFNKNTLSKKKIAKVAAKLVQDNDVIILDSGTTTLGIPSEIEAKNVTIVTHDIYLAMEIAKLRRFKLIVVGGMLNETVYSLIGNDTENYYRKLHVNKTFMGCDAYDLTFGVSDRSAQEAPIKRVIKTAGTYSIILADSSKLGEKAFAKVCEPFDMDFFITDNMNDDMKEKMESRGVKVIIA